MTNPVIERVEARVLLDPYLSLTGLAGYSGLSVRKLRAHLADVMHPLPCYRVGGRSSTSRSRRIASAGEQTWIGWWTK
jgi:hypothetical protein